MVSVSNAAIVLDSIKESFNFVVVLEEISVNGSGLLGVCSAKDMALRDQAGQEVAFVSHRPRQIVTQQRLGLFVVRLLARENEPAAA